MKRKYIEIQDKIMDLFSDENGVISFEEVVYVLSDLMLYMSTEYVANPIESKPEEPEVQDATPMQLEVVREHREDPVPISEPITLVDYLGEIDTEPKRAPKKSAKKQVNKIRELSDPSTLQDEIDDLF